MAETTINLIDALRGQQEQLKRLLIQKMWIGDAPKAALSEIEAQINELKRLLAQLESDIKTNSDEAHGDALRHANLHATFLTRGHNLARPPVSNRSRATSN